MTSSLPYFGLTKRVIVVDAETSSRVDLPKCGAARYWADPSTRVLMMGFQEVGGPESRVWQPHTGATALPSFLLDAAAAPSSEVMFAAFNAPFDRAAFERCGVPTRLDQWLDLMTLSYVLAFAGGLDAVLQQFDVLDPTTGKPLTKSSEGRRLITLFSQQRTPWFDRPAEWSQFVGYCRHDVEVEVALFHRLCLWLNQPFLWPQVQTILKQWQIDQRMNERGIPVSLETVKGAIRIRDAEIKRLTDQMRALTGLANPNSGTQLHAWLTAQGQTLPNLQAATVREALAAMAPDSVPAQVLAAKVEIGRSSVKKYDAMLRSHVDGRLKGGYVTCGASRTGRTASRGINLSNLERPKLKDSHLEWAADLLETGDPATLDLWRSDPRKVSTMGVLGSCVRGALKAPPGYGITAVDLKSIESVGLAWLAGCDTILDLFFEGRDTYKDFATRYYGTRYEDVTGDQRTFCKPAVLGCFAADTQVLTDRGCVPIVDITTNDKLWDGIEWITHDGIAYQGVKTVLSRAGVEATPGHLILQGSQWVRWEHLTDEFLSRDNSSGCGLSSGTHQLNAHTPVSACPAGPSKPFRPITCVVESLNLAGRAPILRSVMSEVWRRCTGYRKTIAIGYRTAFMRRADAALTRQTPITTLTVGVGSSAALPVMISSGTSCGWTAGITQTLRWIASTTTGITKREISALSHAASRLTTPGSTCESRMTGGPTPPPSSTVKSCQRFETCQRSRGRSKLAGLLRKLSRIKRTAKVPTYDVLNAGPRNRFTILTAHGPQIAHNCGYGASGSALVAYAAGMGITLTQEEADRSVETFRASFPEIPALWQAVDRAAKSAILQPNVPIHTHRTTFLYDGAFLHIRLPSNRTLFYYKPTIERRLIKSKHKDRDDFWADNITYMGKQQDDGGAWMRVATRGAKLVENLIQAICRDVLYNALELIDRDPEMQLIGSTYDEAILLTPLDDRAPAIWERLTSYMTTKPSWADERFFLGCDGYLNAARYRK